MNKILIAIPFCKGDGAMAEKLCDWIFFLNGKQSRGHCLLVPSGDIHAELVTKVQLAAEVSFESVSVCPNTTPTPAPTKFEGTNRAFLNAATFVNTNFKWPFLFLEPDCVPLQSHWLESLSEAYRSQPKRYMGPIMKYTLPDKTEKLFLARVAVYPPDAVNDLKQYCGTPQEFSLMAGENLVRMSAKSQLFQQMQYKDGADKAKLRSDAVLLHGDKKGQLMSVLRGELKPAPVANGEVVAIRTTQKPARVAA